MMQGTVIELDSTIAIIAAQISADEKLPLADSIILATSRHYHATLWTQDSDFMNITDVRYIKK